VVTEKVPTIGVGEGETATVPVDVDGQTVYLTVRTLNTLGAGPDHEAPIAARIPRLEDALDALTGLARTLGSRLRRSDASRVVVQFGCEFVLESGSFLAVVGKASATSTFTVELEWVGPAVP